MTGYGRHFVSGLVAVGVALAVLAGTADAGATGPVIGVGEQKPGMFASKPWQRLGLRHARYTAPWDALQDRPSWRCWTPGCRRRDGPVCTSCSASRTRCAARG